MKLFIYEHCPFCVIAKMIFVLKNQPVQVECLLYDDVHTPMRLTGRKLLPILEYQPHQFMPESRDIVQYIDNQIDSPKITIPEASILVEWSKRVQRFIYRLTYPRWIQAPFPEFATEGARKYYLQSKDPSGGGFISDLADPGLLSRAQKAVDVLEGLLAAYPLLDGQRALSWDDFSLFAHLRSLSIVKGLTYGPVVDRWRKQASEVCYIALHDAYAV